MSDDSRGFGLFFLRHFFGLQIKIPDDMPQ
jgi:hypothetical protein